MFGCLWIDPIFTASAPFFHASGATLEAVKGVTMRARKKDLQTSVVLAIGYLGMYLFGVWLFLH